MNKIKIFTNHYFPENFKLNELTSELSKSFVIEVISQTPNYPKGDFFESYSWFKRNKEMIGAISVKRLPVIPRKEGKLMLLLNYFSYTISSFFYSQFTRDKADHVFVYITSPIFIAWAGLRFAKRNKVECTLYLLDLWPGSLISILNLKNETMINLLENMCIKIYKRFDNIVVSSYGFIEVLEDYGIADSKISYIPQHAEKVAIRKSRSDEESKIIKIVFTGNIGEAQGIDVLVDTAVLLKKDNFKNVRFTIVGDGRYKTTLEKNVRNNKVEDYFTFTGYIAQSKITDILENNHFGFVSLGDDDIFNRTLPAKVQSYMAEGMPILAAANGEVPWLIEKAKCGLSVKADDSSALASLIMEIDVNDHTALDKMSQNSYNYSIEHFNKEKIVKQFIQIMKEGKKYV